MKTITKNDSYERVTDEVADVRIKTGWKFCPKSEWKKNVRDSGTEEKKKKKGKES